MTYFIDIQLVEYYFMGGGVNCKKNKKKNKTCSARFYFNNSGFTYRKPPSLH